MDIAKSIWKWLKGVGVFMVRFLETEASDEVAEIGDIALDIVARVQSQGGTGDEKRARAQMLMIAALPKVSMLAINIAIELAVAIYKEMTKKAGCPGDQDCDGIPDAVDPWPNVDCPSMGSAGCVLPDGTVDWGCDGKP